MQKKRNEDREGKINFSIQAKKSGPNTMFVLAIIKNVIYIGTCKVQ